MIHLNRVHLNGLRALEAVGRLGSLQNAADELGVSAGAVSQQIIKAERQLGRTLFERSPRGLVPTELGRAFLIRIGAGFRELDRAVASVRSADDTVLVVSVAPVFAARWLVPRLSRFSQRHPGIKVRIDASVDLIDFDMTDVDLAVRVGAGDWPGVKASFLLPQEVFPVCAPHLAARLKTPEDVLSVPVLRDVNSTIGWDVWLAQFGIAEKQMSEGNSFTDSSLCLDAAIAGQGIMLAWQTLAQDALAAGRLVAPYRERAATGLGYWLVTSAGRQKPAKVRNFERWIVEEIAASLPASDQSSIASDLGKSEW
jgi:LysR family glycine cleavage system transcriptional activator